MPPSSSLLIIAEKKFSASIVRDLAGCLYAPERVEEVGWFDKQRKKIFLLEFKYLHQAAEILTYLNDYPLGTSKLHLEFAPALEE